MLLPKWTYLTIASALGFEHAQNLKSTSVYSREIEASYERTNEVCQEPNETVLPQEDIEVIGSFLTDIAVEFPALHEKLATAWETDGQIPERLTAMVKLFVTKELKLIEAGTPVHQIYHGILALYRKYSDMSDVFEAYFLATNR
jgi:hypothetical protein